MTDGETYPWGPDFVKEGTLVGITTCDSGATKFSSYNGPNREGGVGLYRGMIITIRDEVRCYIFSPNPNSMSPITSSFMRDEDGKLSNVTSDERDKLLKVEAPNLFALFYEQDNDAEHETFE